MTTTIISDTHQFIERLKEHGFSQQQATGLVEVTKQELDLSHLATKTDLHNLTNTLTNRMIAIVGIGVALLALIKFL